MLISKFHPHSQSVGQIKPPDIEQEGNPSGSLSNGGCFKHSFGSAPDPQSLALTIQHPLLRGLRNHPPEPCAQTWRGNASGGAWALPYPNSPSWASGHPLGVLTCSGAPRSLGGTRRHRAAAGPATAYLKAPEVEEGGGAVGEANGHLGAAGGLVGCRLRRPESCCSGEGGHTTPQRDPLSGGCGTPPSLPQEPSDGGPGPAPASPTCE